jgi:hypothetical protein
MFLAIVLDSRDVLPSDFNACELVGTAVVPAALDVLGAVLVGADEVLAAPPLEVPPADPVAALVGVPAPADVAVPTGTVTLDAPCAATSPAALAV